MTESPSNAYAKEVQDIIARGEDVPSQAAQATMFGNFTIISMLERIHGQLEELIDIARENNKS